MECGTRNSIIMFLQKTAYVSVIVMFWVWATLMSSGLLLSGPGLDAFIWGFEVLDHTIGTLMAASVLALFCSVFVCCAYPPFDHPIVLLG